MRFNRSRSNINTKPADKSTPQASWDSWYDNGWWTSSHRQHQQPAVEEPTEEQQEHCDDKESEERKKAKRAAYLKAHAKWARFMRSLDSS